MFKENKLLVQRCTFCSLKNSFPTEHWLYKILIEHIEKILVTLMCNVSLCNYSSIGRRNSKLVNT